MNTRLREARRRQKKTQQKLADYAGISLKSYQRIEYCLQSPTVKIAILIAKALESTVEYLFEATACKSQSQKEN